MSPPFASGYAVDGNPNTNFANKHCSHDQNPTDAWWICDMRNFYVVQRVVIYGRSELGWFLIFV